MPQTLRFLFPFSVEEFYLTSNAQASIVKDNWSQKKVDIILQYRNMLLNIFQYSGFFSSNIYTPQSFNTTRCDFTDTVEHKSSCLETHKKEVSADKTFCIKV